MRKSTINYIDTVIEFMKYATAGKPIIVFDLETTGLKRKVNKILSCSAVKYRYNAGTFEEIGKLDLFMNPGFHIPKEISAINGITDEMVKDAPDEDEGFKEIYKFFGDNPIVAGYNSTCFDQDFMEDLYQRAGGMSFTPLVHLDVLKMAKEKLHITNHKLSNVAEELGCDIGLTFHRSIDDVYATMKVFKVLLGMYLAPEEKCNKTVKVWAYNYWAPSHTLARIYIRTNPNTKTYYNIFKKSWHSDEKGLNLDDVRRQAFKLANATNEKEFVAAAKAKTKVK